MKGSVKIPWKASRKGGKRACMCEDDTYSIKCCDGTRLAQGIGKIIAET
jgi:hypothetical protein